MYRNRAYKILFVTAELAPLSKVGGLGDVSCALPKALRQLGHDVRIIMPYYGTIDPESFPISEPCATRTMHISGLEQSFSIRQTCNYGVPVYLVDQPHYYNRNAVYGFADDGERFAYFCRAVLESLPLLDWQPDILHCNDWHTGLIPLWLRTAYAADPFYASIASLYTLHVLAYQGCFSRSVLDALGMGATVPAGEMINPVEQGICYTDMLNTVSETYAQEILTPACGEGLHELLSRHSDKLSGILNGIDYEIYNPVCDPDISANYDALDMRCKLQDKLALQSDFHLRVDPAVPLVGMVSRLAEHKGFDLVMQTLEPLLEQLKIQVVLLGSGEQIYQDFFRSLAARYPDRMGIAIGFNAGLAQCIYAGSDIFLMPSRVEPCGLAQLIALRYGAIPVVHRTGGLADTVEDYDPETNQGTGFSFDHYTPQALTTALTRAVAAYHNRDVWDALIYRAMHVDNSWNASARKYDELYTRAYLHHNGTMQMAAM